MTIATTFSKPWNVPLTGRYLAHNHLDRLHRAFLAADLHAGKYALATPTLVQAAALARVDRTTAWWASHRQSERAEILAGLMPLIPPRPAPAKPHLSDSELAEIISTVGVNHLLDVAAEVELGLTVS